MRKLGYAAAALGLATLASCAPRQQLPPDPAPQRQLPARPEPVPPPPPAPDWREAALSPGDWTYRNEGGASIAQFGQSFMLRCEPSRQVSLILAGAGGNAMTLRTTYGDRNLPAAQQQAGRPALVASVAASDPLLDSIVFSRGRFAVEGAGAPRLIAPAWPETARVVEDCRA